MVRIERVDVAHAADAVLVDAVTDVINRAYLAVEAELWTQPMPRTNHDEVRSWIDNGALLVAYVEDRLVGAVISRVIRDADPPAAWFGALSVDPTMAGQGVASRIVDHIEQHARDLGIGRVQIEMLWADNAHQLRLASWYANRGYVETSRQPLVEFAPDDDAFAATDIAVVVLVKALSPR
jgi:GNAT superfamily N-acetyltransferase